MRLVEEFRIYLSDLGYGRTTVQMLPICLKEFLLFTRRPLKELKQEDIRAFYHYLQERPNKRREGGLSAHYIQHHVYALKLFFAWQIRQGILTINPISGLEFPTPKAMPREILTLEEIHGLYQSCENYLWLWSPAHRRRNAELKGSAFF